MSFSTARIAAGYSLDDVAREFSVPEATVRAWEAGTASPPPRVAGSLEVIGRMATHDKPDGIAPQQPEFAAIRDEGPLFQPDKLIKSKKRVADHGEVFTPPWLVEKMLDLVKGETERIDARFLEPACGSGNFLVPILQRKLAAVEARYGRSDFEKRQYALLALSGCYGIELLPDNIAECRANMLAVFAEYLALVPEDDLYRAAAHMLSLNLIHGDAMTMKMADGGPIVIVEWGYIGKGKFVRRDFRLDVLTTRASFGEDSLFGGDAGRHEIFRPIGEWPPRTVRDLAEEDA
jgi:N-6 DNA Methylase